MVVCGEGRPQQALEISESRTSPAVTSGLGFTWAQPLLSHLANGPVTPGALGALFGMICLRNPSLGLEFEKEGPGIRASPERPLRMRDITSSKWEGATLPALPV